MKGDVLLETERLYLRCWRESDLSLLQGILCDDLTMAHWPQPFDEVSSAAWLARAVDGVDEPLPGRLAVHLKSDDGLIGDAGLLQITVNDAPENDLGYIIHRDHWRQGYGFEAAEGLLRFAHEVLGCHRVVASMAEDNLPSAQVARKLGMVQEGSFVNAKNLGKTHLLFVSEA